jgi:hypothetical protein
MSGRGRLKPRLNDLAPLRHETRLRGLQRRILGRHLYYVASVWFREVRPEQTRES